MCATHRFELQFDAAMPCLAEHGAEALHFFPCLFAKFFEGAELLLFRRLYE